MTDERRAEERAAREEKHAAAVCAHFRRQCDNPSPPVTTRSAIRFGRARHKPSTSNVSLISLTTSFNRVIYASRVSSQALPGTVRASRRRIQEARDSGQRLGNLRGDPPRGPSKPAWSSNSISAYSRLSDSDRSEFLLYFYFDEVSGQNQRPKKPRRLQSPCTLPEGR